MARWDDAIEPSAIDRHAFLFCGADPCWSPDREEKLAGAEDKRAGECNLCGGDAGFPLVDADGLPVLDESGVPVAVRAIAQGSHRVCARCMRSGDDPHSRAARPRGGPAPAPVVEAGYVARDGVQVPERFARMLEG